MVLSQYRSIKTTDLQHSRVQKKLSKSDMQKIDMVLSKMDVDKSISDHAEEQSKEEGFEKGEAYGFTIDTLVKADSLDEECSKDVKAHPVVLQPSGSAYGFEVEPLSKPLELQVKPVKPKPIVIDVADDDVVLCGDDDDDVVGDDSEDIINAAMSYVPPDVEGKQTKKQSTPKAIKKDTATPKGTATSKSTKATKEDTATAKGTATSKSTVKVSFICLL